MRKIVFFILVLVGLNKSVCFSQGTFNTGGALSNVPGSCLDYIAEGITPLLQNKTWRMVQLYVNSIPMKELIPKDSRFVFSADSAQTDSTLILSMLQTVRDTIVNSNFIYKFNESNFTISLYHGKTGVLQKTFKIICLSKGHLAFTFPENGKDADGNPRFFEMEYRFLVDYTFENEIIQNALNNPNQ